MKHKFVATHAIDCPCGNPGQTNVNRNPSAMFVPIVLWFDDVGDVTAAAEQ